MKIAVDYVEGNSHGFNEIAAIRCGRFLENKTTIKT